MTELFLKLVNEGGFPGLFMEMDDEELSFFVGKLRAKTFPAQCVVYQESHPVDEMIFLLSGKLKVEKDLQLTFGGDAAKKLIFRETLIELNAGKVFTESALMEDVEMPGELVAFSECESLMLSRGSYEALLSENSEVGRKFQAGLLRKCVFDKKQWLSDLAASKTSSLYARQLLVEQEKIRAIHRIARSTELSSVQQIFDSILSICLESLQLEKGSVMIVDQGKLRVEAAFGPDKDAIVGTVQEVMENTISGKCFLGKLPVFIEDIVQVKELRRAGDGGKYASNSVLSLPLMSAGGESIGVLNVSKTSNEPFRFEDLLVLEDLAKEAGVALGHEIQLAKLYKEFQTTSIELERARNILEQIAGRMDRAIEDSWKG